METIEKVVWTLGYRPFVMGGSVHFIVGCRLECTGPHELGKGFQGYVIQRPDGDTLIAEAETGAIIGSTLEQVREDVEQGDIKVMRKQIANAREAVKRVELLPEVDFWRANRFGPGRAEPPT